MKRKEIERRIREEYEQSLPGSGISFDALSSRVDFSQYEKRQKPFYQKPLTYVLISCVLVVVVASVTLGIVFRSSNYQATGSAFYEGIYRFSKIAHEYNVDELPKPAASDKITIGNEPVGTTYFALSKSKNGYDGYLSVSGALEEYEMTVVESDQGILKFLFRFDEVDFSASIYGSINEKDIFCSIEAPSKSLSFVFSK